MRILFYLNLLSVKIKLILLFDFITILYFGITGFTTNFNSSDYYIIRCIVFINTLLIIKIKQELETKKYYFEIDDVSAKYSLRTWHILLIVIATIFNPIIPLRFNDQEVWISIDWISFFILFYYCLTTIGSELTGDMIAVNSLSKNNRFFLYLPEDKYKLVRYKYISGLILQINYLERKYEKKPNKDILIILYSLISLAIQIEPNNTNYIKKRREIKEMIPKCSSEFETKQDGDQNEIDTLIKEFPNNTKYLKERGIRLAIAVLNDITNNVIKYNHEISCYNVHKWYEIIQSTLDEKTISLLGQSKKDLENYIKLNENDGEVFFFLGLAKYMLKENACQEFHQSFKLKYKTAESYYNYVCRGLVRTGFNPDSDKLEDAQQFINKYYKSN